MPNQKFHNPYHFVPVSQVKPDDSSKTWLAKKELRNNKQRLSHDRYHSNTHSGRIVCRMKTVGPIFIGATRCREGTDDHPAEVTPFELNCQPAIPATSLRGMISSIAEAASGSALRVLENQILSYHNPMGESLSALGMVFIEQYENGKTVYKLQPLALPTLEKNNGLFKIPYKYQAMFCRDKDGALQQPRFKVYISQETTISDPHNNGKSPKITSYRHDTPKFHYMELRKDWKFTEDHALADLHEVRNPRVSKNGLLSTNFLLGIWPRFLAQQKESIFFPSSPARRTSRPSEK